MNKLMIVAREPITIQDKTFSASKIIRVLIELEDSYIITSDLYASFKKISKNNVTIIPKQYLRESEDYFKEIESSFTNESILVQTKLEDLKEIRLDFTKQQNKLNNI